MKEWYLMTDSNRPHMLGGFENDSFNNYKDDSLDEILETDLARTVTIYSSDLSKSKTVRGIIQDNVSNTHLNSMHRCGIFPIGTILAGQYVLFENRFWLATGYPGNNGVYEKVTLELCQYKIRWQDDIGVIHERWVALSSASKYEMGEDSRNYVITMTTNNYIMKVGYDIYSFDLVEKRIFIDGHIPPTVVFKITRADDVLYDYGDTEHGYVLSFILDKSEFNKDTDNQELRICDYYKPLPSPIPPTPTQQVFVSISGSSILKIGSYRVYTLSFTDIHGNTIDSSTLDYKVKMNTDIDNSNLWIDENYSEKDKVKIRCKNETELIDSVFSIVVDINSSTGYESIGSKPVEIADVM